LKKKAARSETHISNEMVIKNAMETKCLACDAYICYCICPNVTGYSKKRRLLREHRKTMRVMEDVILESGLDHWFQQKLRETDAQDWGVSSNSELDETSDKEDPEAELKKESDKTHDFVQAARDALECEALRRDLDRKSMMLEDRRAS